MRGASARQGVRQGRERGKKWRFLYKSPFRVKSQRDTLSSGCPEKHERDRNKPPGCKTETAAEAGPLNGGDRIGKYSSTSEEKHYSAAALWASGKPGNDAFDQLATAIRAAPKDRLHALTVLVWQGNADGHFTDDQATELAAIADGRKATTAPHSPMTMSIAAIIGPQGENRRQSRIRDRTASRGRKRTLGGAGAMPHSIRAHYTEGERAALNVIALEVKRRGFCDWPVDKIAAVAGVSKRTVQYALATASAADRRHVKVERRRVSANRNKTNLITIISAEWTTWLKRGPSLASIDRTMAKGGGCKEMHGTKKGVLYPDNSAQRESAEFGRCGQKGLWKREIWRGRTQPGTGRAHAS